MSIAPANATDATPMEADANSEMNPDQLDAAAQRVLNGEGEESLLSPGKRSRQAVCTLASNHHHFALHMGCCNAPKNPGCVTARVRNMGESLENKKQNPHQVVHQVATESNRKQAQASASKRKLAQASAS